VKTFRISQRFSQHSPADTPLLLDPLNCPPDVEDTEMFKQHIPAHDTAALTGPANGRQMLSTGPEKLPLEPPFGDPGDLFGHASEKPLPAKQPARSARNMTGPGAGSAGADGMLPRLLSIKDTAGVLGISVAHLRREIRLKRLAVHRIGRLVRIAEADLAAYLARHRRGAR
jgi:excisionase family DNA binding protein